MILFWLAAATSAVNAAHASGADPSQELCFLNNDPRLAETVPVLGPYAVDKGACQGMSAIMAAFREGARFAPHAAAPATEAQAQAILDRLMSRHAGGCGPAHAGGAAAIEVPGFASLRAFCEAFPRIFLREAVVSNAEIAVLEIAPIWPEFRWRKHEPIEGESSRRLLHDRLAQVFGQLRRGKSPLLLYFSHVVMVTQVAAYKDELAFEIIDPNVRGAKVIRIPYGADGLPLAGQSPMYWEISPHRAWVSCAR